MRDTDPPAGPARSLAEARRSWSLRPAGGSTRTAGRRRLEAATASGHISGRTVPDPRRAVDPRPTLVRIRVVA